MAQGLQRGLVDFLGRHQDHPRQRVLRQILERFAETRLLLQLGQGLFAADPLGFGDVRHPRDLVAQLLPLGLAGVHLHEQGNLRRALPGTTQALDIAE
ncbi:hypothetical protein D3C76_1649510 [compost metagenome]